MRAALYARVSTSDQNCDNQLIELRRYCEARGFQVTREYTDHGVSGSKDRRPALDDLVSDARRRRFDVLVCAKLDRLGRNLKHLLTMLDDLTSLGIGFISLSEGIDLTTPSGRLMLHVLGALAQWERSRIQERVKAGLARVKASGKRLGRPVKVIPEEELASVRGLSLRQAAARLGVSRSTAHRWLSR
ncbi:MAG: recombinase family protein [Vicinamibacterales bacterium]